MEHYVTLFDSLFLPQGLALYASLKQHAEPFRLWVICIDDRTKDVLDSLAMPSMKTVALSDIETTELLAIKSSRTRAEYCWTLTPLSPKVVFDSDPDVKRVTYLDADIYFLKSPRPIFDEFEISGKAVMITDHAYDAEYDKSETSGQYCVQFMIFKRDSSELVRAWWQERCIEWCFARFEGGRFGDQKYLDDWPTRFAERVHVLSQLDVLLAPWNARRFPYSRAIAWHFHGLRLLNGGKVLLHSQYAVPRAVDDFVYAPYIRQLRVSLGLIGSSVIQGRVRSRPFLILGFFRFFLKSARELLRQLYSRDVIRRMPT